MSRRTDTKRCLQVLYCDTRYLGCEESHTPGSHIVFCKMKKEMIKRGVGSRSLYVRVRRCVSVCVNMVIFKWSMLKFSSLCRVLLRLRISFTCTSHFKRTGTSTAATCQSWDTCCVVCVCVCVCDMRVCVCVCTCVCARACACMCTCVRACVWMCDKTVKRAPLFQRATYSHACVSVCVCVCRENWSHGRP